jgi:hypothetical protein
MIVVIFFSVVIPRAICTQSFRDHASDCDCHPTLHAKRALGALSECLVFLARGVGEVDERLAPGFTRWPVQPTDLMLAMGVGALSSFVVNGWPDMYVTIGTYIAARKEDLGDRAARMAFENRRRRKRLPETPGRITPQFEP